MVSTARSFAEASAAADARINRAADVGGQDMKEGVGENADRTVRDVAEDETDRALLGLENEVALKMVEHASGELDDMEQADHKAADADKEKLDDLAKKLGAGEDVAADSLLSLSGDISKMHAPRLAARAEMALPFQKAQGVRVSRLRNKSGKALELDADVWADDRLKATEAVLHVLTNRIRNAAAAADAAGAEGVTTSRKATVAMENEDEVRSAELLDADANAEDALGEAGARVAAFAAAAPSAAAVRAAFNAPIELQKVQTNTNAGLATARNKLAASL